MTLFNYRQIMFKLPSETDPESLKQVSTKAQKALNKIKKRQEDFNKVATEFSEGPEKSVGGDIGFLSINQMVPEFQKVITSMKVGDISDIIKTSYGYHIIKLEEEKEPYIPEFNEIEEKVKNRYFKSLWNQKFDTLISSLRENSTIEVSEQHFIE